MSRSRTFSHQQLVEAQQAWDQGGFTEEWRDWRHLAAMQAGIIVPPQGSGYDSWADDRPSERALLIRAIRETPDLLKEAILSPKVHSWAAVIAIVVRGRDERHQDALREEEWHQDRGEHGAGRGEAFSSLKAILEGVRHGSEPRAVGGGGKARRDRDLAPSRPPRHLVRGVGRSSAPLLPDRRPRLTLDGELLWPDDPRSREGSAGDGHQGPR